MIFKKEEQIVKNQYGGLKMPLFDLLAMSCSFRCQNPKHQPIVPSTLLALQQIFEQTKPQRYMCLDH